MRRVPIPLWLPWALLALALIALFHRLLLGDVLFWGLPSLQFYPWRHYAFEEVLAGRWPAWNPWVGAGAPLIANYQTALFYPPNWAFLVLPDAHAMSVIALAHIVWTFAGMWLFARALGLSRLGRSISALAFALSGYVIGRVGSFPTADTVAWIPWIFWLVERVITRRRWPDAGWLGLAFGMQLLAGHAQTTWYGGVGVGLYALWRVVWQRRDDPRQWRAAALGMAGLGMALGVLLAGVQLVPTAEYLLESQRSGGLDYDIATNLSFSPFRLVTLLSPNFYGSPVDGSYLTEGIFFEDAVYIGILPVVLAGAALWGWFRRRKVLVQHAVFRTVPFWGGLALVALVIATGRYGPVYPLLFEHVPTFSAFRDPVRWLVLAEFGLALLAGIGVEAWRRGKWIVFWSRLTAAGGAGLMVMGLLAPRLVDATGDELRVLSLGIVVLGAGMAGVALLTLVHPGPELRMRPALWEAAVLLFVTLDLTWAGSGLNPGVPAAFYGTADIAQPDGRIYWREEAEEWVKYEELFDLSDYRLARDNWEAVRVSRLPNLTMLDGIPVLNNFDPLVPEFFRRYIALVEASDAAAGPLLKAAGVTTVIGDVPEGWVQEKPGALTGQAEGFAYLVPEATWVEDDAAVEAALCDPAWDPAQTVILIGDAPPPGGASVPVGGTVRVATESASRVVYEVETDNAGYLVMARTWYPGWSATVNGTQADLLRANLAFQAVRVPAGRSEIVLAYRSRGERTGAILSVIGALMVGGLISGSAWKARSAKVRGA